MDTDIAGPSSNGDRNTTKNITFDKKLKKKKRSQWCSAINCTNNRLGNKDMSFFRFPKDKERCRRWVLNSRRKDLLNKSAEHLHKSNVLCPNHFELSEFTSLKKTRLKRLKAIPTLFNVPNPPNKIISTRQCPKQRKSASVKKVPMKNKKVSPAPELQKENPKVSALKKKIDSQRKRIKRLRTTHKKPAILVKKDIEHLKNLSSKYLKAETYNFFCSQLDRSLIKKGKWSSKDKSNALSIYHSSPKTYRLLQKQFTLPSIKTLNRTMKNIDIYPGFSKQVLDAFKIKVSNMTPKDKLCALVFDEIALKHTLSYNNQKDFIEGYEDYGDDRIIDCDSPADHATVFVARGLVPKWKQPFGYILTSSTIKADILKDLLIKALSNLKATGVIVKVVICDQGSNNRAVLPKLGVSETNPFFIHEEQKVFFLMDPPHLIKSVRNNLKNYDFVTSEGEVSWKVIKDFFERDLTTRTRMAPKLTSKHINVPPFSKMAVYLATQVLSKSVANGIAWCVDFGIFPESYMATSNFIKQIDDLFDVFNSFGDITKAKYRIPITKNSIHIPFLKSSLVWLKELKYIKRKPDGSVKKVLPATKLPCFRGWIQSINALLLLVDDILSEDIPSLCTNRLNQDCVENMFSIVRGKGGHRDNPCPAEFRFAFRQIMVDRLLSVSEYSNCKDDVDHFLLNLSSSTITTSASVNTATAPLSTVITTHSEVVQSVDAALHPHIQENIQEKIQEENIIAYICGFIIKKLVNAKIACLKCGDVLEESTETNARHLGLITAKQHDHCQKGGLFKPTIIMTNVVIVFENITRQKQIHMKR